LLVGTAGCGENDVAEAADGTSASIQSDTTSAWADSRRQAQGPAPPPSVDRTIRALLARDVTETQVRCESGLLLAASETGLPLSAAEKHTKVHIAFLHDAIYVSPPGESVTHASIEVSSREEGALQVWLDDEWRSFRGTIRCILQDSRSGAAGDDAGSTRRSAGAIVNVVDIESYLVGVVAAELTQSFHPQAFEVQAIIARTYAWYQKQVKGQSRDWDVWTTEKSQVYMGLRRQQKVPRAAEAVNATRGLVCTARAAEGERIFCTYYSSRCGGTTQAAVTGPGLIESPVLCGGVACPYCESNPYEWGPVKLSKSELTTRLAERFPVFARIGTVQEIQIAESTDESRPVRMTFVGASGRTWDLTAETFRLTVDPGGRELRSTHFTIREEGDRFIFTGGRGFGHGIGLCQYGANYLAEKGETALEILQHYYPGSSVRRAY
jgi:stage II sporulation protein D